MNERMNEELTTSNANVGNDVMTFLTKFLLCPRSGRILLGDDRARYDADAADETIATSFA